MRSNFNLDSTSQLYGAVPIIFSISLVYSIALLLGLSHYLNFLPSSPWTIIATLISVIFGFLSVPAVAAMEQLISPASNLLSSKPNDSKAKTIFISLLMALILSFPYNGLIAYGVAPLLTSFSSTIIEKDITGTKKHYHSRKRADDYFIDSPDLSEGLFAKLYITEEEFETAPSQIHMHITYKQSFFGMSVEQYIFLTDHTKY